MKMTSYKMPGVLIDELAAENRRSGVPKSEIVRRALAEYLGRIRKEQGPTRRRGRGRANDTTPST